MWFAFLESVEKRVCVSAANQTLSRQMADLKENIEDEIHSAHDQYLKMDSHVKLYMNEIEHLM